jgi:folate-dependent phosphoribosylglycinamide formyltransferase PurN
MSLSTAVLTTDTPHHRYFLRRLAEASELALVVLETRTPTPPFETDHPFEVERDRYEFETLLGGDGDRPISELAATVESESVNEPRPRDALRDCGANMVVVFGTGILGDELIESVEAPLLNLHGGNPEEYRGLDTHLWAIYHRDFENLVTTLHMVDAGLDTGPIVGDAPVELTPGMRLAELRAANTEVCVRLTLDAIETLSAGKSLSIRKQRRCGRYYSFMPAILKDGCVRKFDEHVAGL